MRRTYSSIAADRDKIAKLDFGDYIDVSDIAKDRFNLSPEDCTEIVYFSVHRSSIIPPGLGSMFKNLKHFFLRSGDLSRLSKVDLKHFPLVFNLHFDYNQLEYLEDDLFINNQQLIYIGLAGNKITQVGSNIRLHLMGSLFKVELRNNRCIDIIFCNKCQDSGVINNFPDLQRMFSEQCTDLMTMRNNFAQTSDKLEKVSENLIKAQDSIEKFSQIIERVYNLILLVTKKEIGSLD